MALRTVKLYGRMAKKYGRVHRLDVATPAEAVRALCVNCPGLREELMTAHERGVAYRCIVDDADIDEADLTAPMSKTFAIVPVVMGANILGDIFKIVAGVALMVFAAPIALAIAPGSMSLTAAIGTVMAVGAALTLSGIGGLLAPTPKTKDENGNTKNNVFNGPENVTAQGVPVPIGYGRMVVGSAVINAAITVEDPTPAFNFMGGFFGYGA